MALTHKLKFNARMLQLGEVVDQETDRVTMSYPFKRIIKYRNIGVTATDIFTTKDANKVVKKIETRIYRVIEENQKDYRIEIKEVIYQIERIYVREEDRVMEVSLSYVN